MNNKSIIFMGTSDFSLKSLAAIHEAKFNVIGVYTRPPKPTGRSYRIQKSIIHRFAEEKNIPVYCSKNFRSDEEVELFRSLKPDLAIVSSYGLIIPQNMLNIPTYGFINIHASLLPRWRGATPIQSSILAGDNQTGITIIKMDSGIDTGNIILAEPIDISSKTNYGELSDRLGALGASMILKVLNDIDNSLLKSQKQPQEGSTYAKKITTDSCRINWNDSAENILRHIKAFSPIPAAWTEIDDMRIKIFDAELIDANSNLQPGFVQESMIIACKVKSLKLIEIQSAGKNKMSGDDFVRGRRNLIGKIAK
ncbi:MAG: methionyl-tRNA formyltransferase [Holosporaceae bacterium]|jgi:methionyl-tRNA formyltransferase|nr:methionyl-tRNA formyltransferase [Holosporaceae bacterium]